MSIEKTVLNALTNVEPNMPELPRFAGSVVAQISEMEPGECVTKSIALPLSDLDSPDQIGDALHNVRKSLSSSLRHVTKRYPDREYKVESATVLYPSGSIFAQSTVRRIA